MCQALFWVLYMSINSLKPQKNRMRGVLSFHFTEEETEVQRDEAIHPRSSSKWPRFARRHFGSRVCTVTFLDVYGNGFFWVTEQWRKREGTTRSWPFSAAPQTPPRVSTYSYGDGGLSGDNLQPSNLVTKRKHFYVGGQVRIYPHGTVPD